ncbi:GNAT family N-acetyltransferase [Streptomyces sp. NBC_00162]|uniref:GNAT family N-acetyltransferase n=1 Tax=Streptomyces sp. NBC_00162 TaxID=2903629 RepID=UPI00214BDA2C|nr:GNAT family N-acetyltransferase [Streptomyces sp. NBC_00162]UUU37576.1 N-acetyltransferase [Streptomyces sp. NBC_00162]
MTVVFSQATAEHLPAIREEILSIHQEVRHRDFSLTTDFQSVERFDERLSAYSSRPGWTAVIGHEDGEAVGFCFGVPLGPETKWWSTMTEPLPGEFTREDGQRTVALNEIVVRKPWRGSGVAWQLHEAWLAPRTEQRVTLLVNPASGNGAVQAVYEAWGYRTVGLQQPFPDSPKYAAMIRPLRQQP